jgi:lipopolysaccharide export system protein LptA
VIAIADKQNRKNVGETKMKMRLHEMTKRTVAVAMVFIASTASIATTAAYAEKADRLKEVEITFNKGSSDTSDKDRVVSTVEGDVILTQGTLRIEAARMRVRSDADKQVFAEIFSLPGKQITFREKRDGTNDFIDGVADRAEFDQKNNLLKLFGNARVKSGGDVMNGELITYNTGSERFEISGGTSTTTTPSAAPRSRIVFQPRTDASKDAPKDAPAAGKK